jgi:hypothetical protein
MDMIATKASRFSSLLTVLLGSNLCASAARAAGTVDAVRQIGQLASQARADARGQQATSAPSCRAVRPRSRREAVAMAQRRLQRQRAAGTWRGQKSGSSQHGTGKFNQAVA